MAKKKPAAKSAKGTGSKKSATTKKSSAKSSTTKSSDSKSAKAGKTDLKKIADSIYSYAHTTPQKRDWEIKQYAENLGVEVDMEYPGSDKQVTQRAFVLKNGKSKERVPKEGFLTVAR